MKHSETIGEISKALAAFQAQVEDPKMDEEKEYQTKTGRRVNLKYASLKSILKTARPLLAKNGIAIVQEAKTEGNRVTIVNHLFHTSGEWMESEPYSLLATSAIAQEIGSATTYAKRYSLSAFLGLGAEEDDDGNGATEGIDDGTNQKPEKQTAKKSQKSNAQSKASAPAKPIEPAPQPAQQPAPQVPVRKPDPEPNSENITREQQQALFHAAKGNTDIVKEVLMNHAYVATAEIKTWDYDTILNEIKAKAA